jgi:hypothetical protein
VVLDVAATSPTSSAFCGWDFRAFHCATSYPRSPRDHGTFIDPLRDTEGGRSGRLYSISGLAVCVGGSSRAAGTGGLVSPCFGTLEASTPGTPTSWPGCFTCSRAAACLKAPHKDPCRATSRLQGGKRRVPTLRVLRESVLSRFSCRRKPAVEEANIVCRGLVRIQPSTLPIISPISAGNLEPAVTTRQLDRPSPELATFP